MGNSFRKKRRGRRRRREIPSWKKIKSSLMSSKSSLTERWVALQFCRKKAPSREELGRVLIEALKYNKDSILMRHEIAFALGQTGCGVNVLKKIMRNEKGEDEVTRHEAAESLSTLENCKNDFELYAKNRDQYPILADTCALALEGMRRFLSGEIDAAFAPCGCVTHKNKEDSRLPKALKILTIDEEITACKILKDTQSTLYDRYEALFELRDQHRDIDVAVKTIADTLKNDSSSACFRHELAFTLGILGSSCDAENILISKLRDKSEHSVVRHEAALALQCLESDRAALALRRVSKLSTEDPMVRESCIVALAMRSYILPGTGELETEQEEEYIFGFTGGRSSS